MNMMVFEKAGKKINKPVFLEAENVDNFSSDRKKDFFSGRSALERCMLYYARQRNIVFRPKDFSIATERKEKPKLVFLEKEKISGFENIDFNISHSHGKSLCFLCEDGKAGADLENIRHFDRDLLESFLGNREINFVGKKKRLKKRKATIFWSLKEAYLKAMGTGLLRNPKEIEVLNMGPGLFAIKDGNNMSKSMIRTGRYADKFVWATIKI